jgi:hypothetical protein
VCRIKCIWILAFYSTFIASRRRLYVIAIYHLFSASLIYSPILFTNSTQHRAQRKLNINVINLFVLFFIFSRVCSLWAI